MTRVRLLQAAGGPWTASTSASAGFPDAGNTGAVLPSGLIAVPGSATSGPGWSWSSSQGAAQINTAGATFSGYDVSGGIQVKASDVTVQNSRASGPCTVQNGTDGSTWHNCDISWATGGSGSAILSLQASTNNTVTNCTIYGADATTNRAGACITSSADTTTTISGCNIYWCRQGINLYHLGSYTIQGCYIHDMGFLTGDHTEPVYCTGTATATVTGNTLLNQLSQTAALIIQNKDNVTGNVTVTGNLLAGAGYALYGGGDPSSTYGLGTNITVTGNYVSTQYFPNGGFFGPAIYWNTDPSNTWSGNYWYDGPNAGQVIPHP